jgi:hypothetical protein
VNRDDILVEAFAACLQRADPSLPHKRARQMAVRVRRASAEEFLGALEAVVTEVERLMKERGHVIH